MEGGYSHQGMGEGILMCMVPSKIFEEGWVDGILYWHSIFKKTTCFY